jgi:sugar transferase EpsL
VKRSFDFLLSFIAMLVISPFLLILAVLIRTILGSPVIFKQFRPGLHGESFQLVKFRSMTDEKDADGNLLPDSERIPRFGRFLRSTSLDELPELWNVLKGDMSFVGPRPLLMEYLPLYTKEQSRRHNVRPGLTGWAQVNGRNTLGWDEKFALDVWYVDNRSILLDLKIILMTIPKVLGSKDIAQDGHATMEPFRGSKE